MTTPEASPPSPEPPESNTSSASPSEPADSSPTQPSEPSGTAVPPPSDPQDPTTPPPSVEPPASSGILDWIKRNMLIVGGVTGGGVVIVIIAILFGTGAIGGGGGPSEAKDYLLDGTVAVAVVQVADIMAAPEIPAQLAGFGSLGFPNLDPEDSSDWIDAWESEWNDDFPQIWGGIGLEDITTVLLQEDEGGRDLGWIFFGVFAFEDVRESLEEAGKQSDTYRDFEIWGDDVALLEDRGAILVGAFVQDVLKALDTERGFADDTNVLLQALERAGGGLAMAATSTCSGSFFQASPNGCEAVLEAVISGDAQNTVVSGTYIFGSETRAASGLEDIENAIDTQDTYDADLNEIEADGPFVSYEVSIVGEFVGSARQV